jgi:hypothetical protein
MRLLLLGRLRHSSFQMLLMRSEIAGLLRPLPL